MSPSPENLDKLANRIKKEREFKEEPAYLPQEKLAIIYDEDALIERKQLFKVPTHCKQCGEEVIDEKQIYCEKCGAKLYSQRFE